MKREQLEEVLRLHSLFLVGDPQGKLADFSGADLRDASLSDASLRHADLSGADLSGADLRYADLRNASFRDASLRDASLSGASLSGTDLRGTGLLIFKSAHDAILYPDGRLTYGCETHTLDEWDRLHDGLARQWGGVNWQAYAAETRALVALCRVATTKIGMRKGVKS